MTEQQTGLEILTGLDRLTIHQCESLAKELDANQRGADRKKIAFDLHGPKGKVGAHWLDPWMGIFMIDGADGFNMVSQFEYVPDLWCANVRLKDGDEK